MAQDPWRPKDDGKIKMPPITPGMNKTGPKAKGGGKGSDDDATILTAGEDKRDDEELLARIRKRFDACTQNEAENRKSALDDLKFKSGEGQWPADVAAQRNFDKRPTLTINKLPTFVHQITNDIRQNRPAINISPVGEKVDRKAALVYSGLIRAIQRDSVADIAYDTMVDNQVSNGFGYLRVDHEYESETSFDQVLMIKRIRNPFTVYLDPNHQMPDGSDCQYAFVTDTYPIDEFKQKWPEADASSFTLAGVGEKYPNWIEGKNVRVCEYYEFTTKRRTLIMLDSGFKGWKDELAKEVRDQITAHPDMIVEEREVDTKKLHWYTINALEVLEEREEFGHFIPIVECVGEEIDIEGRRKLSGVIRNAKQPQLMYNYMRTLSVEISALQPKAPWIAAEGQTEGYENEWEQANTKNYSVLYYRPQTLNGATVPPPSRNQYMGTPVGVMNEAQTAAQDMMATTGIRFDATLAERTYDESGKAIKELRRSGDIGNFHFADNFSRSLRHVGAILIDLIPHYYDAKRTAIILREDETEETIQIDPNSPKALDEKQDPHTQKPMQVFNPSIGKYGVTVTIGPSYATKRIEASESMMEFIKAIPPFATGVADLVAKNQDWPGSNEFATRLAALIAQQHPGVIMPESKDMNPQVMALVNGLQNQVKQLTQERQMHVMALNEKNTEHALQKEKIDKDFEAKILKIMADTETKLNVTLASKVENAISAAVSKLESTVSSAGDAKPAPSGGSA